MRIFQRILGLTVLVVVFNSQTTMAVEIKSPDADLIVTVDHPSGRLRLQVEHKGWALIPESFLGLQVDGVNSGDQVRLIKILHERMVNEEYEWLGANSKVWNLFREVVLEISTLNGSSRLYLRAYNDGVAIRYCIPGANNKQIEADLTTFHVKGTAECYWAHYENSNEELHHITRFSEISDHNVLMAPLTAKVGEHYLAFSEAGCIDFPDMSWLKHERGIQAHFTTNPQGWKSEKDTVLSPWRCVIVAESLNALVNSYLVQNLCDPPATGTDFSWVKPGRVLWQWWSSGAPMLDEQRQWLDAAARLNWEYYLIDDGWRDWRQAGKDQWQCLKEVIDYGNRVGVGSIVWVDSKEMRDRESIRKYLTRVKKVGAKGIKIDFVPPATPEVMKWYEMAREETYRLQLLCNFHGCVKPTGLQRTWPHELTREGVRGNEYHMTRYDRQMPQDQDVIVPFTRLLAGPADFTPVIFDRNELRGFTRAHQLAQVIVYNSPLTHFADSYRNYLNTKAEDFLMDVPVVWDETVVLPVSKIGKLVAFAKRKGDEWWIGILNGKEAVRCSFAMNFLERDAVGIILTDVRDGQPYELNREYCTAKKDELFTLPIQPGGGSVIRLKMK